MMNIGQKLKPKYYWIISFFLGALSMYLLLSYAQMLTTGKYIVLAGDSLQIFVSNIRMGFRNLMNGETIWYSFANCLGLNTSLNMAEKMFSPFNILYLIFYNADVNVITAAIIILKTGLAAAFFQLFAAKALKTKGLYSVIFSIFYSMCAFSVTYGIICYMWLDGIYMLPLVALAVHKAVYEKRFTLLTFSYSYIFIVQFYQGYMIGIFSLLYFILLLCTMKKEERITTVGKYVLGYVWSCISSVLISAVLWIPILYFLRGFYASDSTGFEPIGITALQVFNNLFWGESQDYYIAPYVYCGLPCLILLPFYFINKNIPARNRIVSGTLLVFFCLGCIFLPLFKLLHAFDAPDMWNYRFSFIISFILCAIACRQCEFVKELKWKILAGYGLFLVVFYLVEGRIEKLEIGSLSHNTSIGLLINVVCIGLWTLIVVLYLKLEHTGTDTDDEKRIEKQKKNRTGITMALVLLACAESITNGCVKLCSDSFQGALLREEYYYTWTDEMKAVTEAIGSLKDKKEFFRTVVLNDLNKNSDAFWGYNGISDFGTAENQTIRQFLQDMGLYTHVRRTSTTGITPPIEMLLSVKYNVRLFTDTEVAGIEAPPRIRENENYLPIGFMVYGESLSGLEYSDNVFENQNLTFKALSGFDDLYTPVSGEKVVYETYGMTISDDDLPIIMKEQEGANAVIRVNDTEDPVFMQISYDGPPEEITGVYYDVFENLSYSEENTAWIPFAVKLWQSENSHYISIHTLDNYPVMFETKGIYFYELNEERLNDIHAELEKEVLILDECKNGLVKGHISVSGEKKMLFTSIPYTDGWVAYANGKEIETVPVLNDTFLGICLPNAGEYDVELRYHCPGGKIGLVCCIIGLLLFLVQIMIQIKADKKPDSIIETEDTENSIRK